jgi:hypothetical protein
VAQRIRAEQRGAAGGGRLAAPGQRDRSVFHRSRRPGLSRLNICALGIGYEKQTGAKSILWIYTEPRLRILGHPGPGHSGWETGALFRLGVGEIERSNQNPWIFAPGGYVAPKIAGGTSGASWNLQASYRHAIFNGFADPVFPVLGRDRPESDRLTLGLG